MRCSYHPTVESQEFCSACSRPLCHECAHQIKGKVYCQDCLVSGAEWAAAVKGVGVPSDAPKRAALFSLIPGMGAVYNSEYLKAITYFAVFAALMIMGERIHGIFGFGAFVFLIFTMFDSYRTAEANMRNRFVSGEAVPLRSAKDRSPVSWGVFLIVLGFVLMLQNMIPYYFLSRIWPLVFVLFGGYLVYIALRDQEKKTPSNVSHLEEKKESF